MTPAMVAAVKAADQRREAGNKLFKEGQYETAIGEYTGALEALHAAGVTHDVALLTKCWNNRAACACQLQQYKQAVDDCTEVIKRVPTEAKALMRRAFASEALERYAAALADMRAVVALQPGARDASAACIRLSKLVAEQQRQAGAEAAEQAARQPPAPAPAKAPAPANAAKPSDAPSDPAAAAAAADEVKARGTAAFKAGDYKKAAELYYEASRTAPECHTHFSNLALALLKLGQPQHAATAAQRCTELAPTFAKGHYRLGQALRARGDADAACAAFRAGLAHAAGTERKEMQRELEACEKARAAPAPAPAPAPALGAAVRARVGGGAQGLARGAAGLSFAAARGRVPGGLPAEPRRADARLAARVPRRVRDAARADGRRDGGAAAAGARRAGKHQALRAAAHVPRQAAARARGTPLRRAARGRRGGAGRARRRVGAEVEASPGGTVLGGGEMCACAECRSSGGHASGRHRACDGELLTVKV
eukprot:Transcript_21437.p2 GENE.Transcript_21437~~Transcript_21437.p2  ORF type:complete len:483 (-),score=148.52 Transcript_21437:993-2441(-)